MPNAVQFGHHGGGRVGRTQGLAHHVEQLAARGLAVRVSTLSVGDAVWVARARRARKRVSNIEKYLLMLSLNEKF